ncbi:MAG: tetratricopeptide repeat protein [Planctomycetota bacterium]|jgi:uncharacterized protein YoxC
MTEDKIKNLLQKADQTAGHPAPIPDNLTAAVRRRARQRHFANLTIPTATAAIILIAFGIWLLTTKTEIGQSPEKIASLEAQIQLLQARTDAALNLIQEVIENERKQRRLDELQARLANIPDPLEEIQNQVEKTAFILVYQADRMHRELNQKDSAIQAYNQVIRLFPQTRSAEVARQKLSEIQNNSINKKI